MKKLSLYQKLEMGFAIAFIILAALGAYKNNLSMIVLSLTMFSLCLSNVQHSCTNDEINELKEQIKVLEK